MITGNFDRVQQLIGKIAWSHETLLLSLPLSLSPSLSLFLFPVFQSSFWTLIRFPLTVVSSTSIALGEKKSDASERIIGGQTNFFFQAAE